MSIEVKLDEIVASVHRVELAQVEIKADLERNTDDIEEHIKRTNLLEKKLSKVYAFSLIAAGFVFAKYGTDILKVVGLI